MKYRQCGLSNNQIIEYLNCPACEPLIDAVKKKFAIFGDNLYCVYELVANSYGIYFGLNSDNDKYYPCIIIDGEKWELDGFKSYKDAQKEIIHNTMYKLAHRIENNECFENKV